MLTFSKDAQDALNRVDVDHLATSIDDEVERLGLDHIDILKLSISSMDILRPARLFRSSGTHVQILSKHDEKKALSISYLSINKSVMDSNQHP